MGLPSSKLATLLLRGLSLAFLALSLTLLFIDKKKLKRGHVYNYKDVHSYSYMVGTIGIGIAYTIMQTIAFVVLRIITDNDIWVLVDFYGDKVISYLLATGAAAGLGATSDLDNIASPDSGLGGFFGMGYASATILFLAFVCTAILSIMSSFALPKAV
ncbi:CASP-like protein 4D1 [Juglans microcarpa x Juglans regia]|uniref:CASP-like protein 4D1 n=1 Tax=Juglans microcarpa x Juglans regia TaxID=2249226 RepID=UPI001B7E33C8|nr:CASP-like protein 4D1 [Juglans microcarpa x Juglans regia]